MDQFPVVGGPEPWKMWGNEFTVLTTGATQTGQLGKITYKRPETWRFLFVVKWLDNIPNTDFISVRYRLTTGVGLVSTTLDPFTIIRVDGPATRNQMVWQSTVRQPSFEAGAGGIVPGLTTDQFVAQDIQCDADIIEGLSVPIHVTISAFFAPNVHVRPDWFLRKFNGGEIGGS